MQEVSDTENDEVVQGPLPVTLNYDIFHLLGFWAQIYSPNVNYQIFYPFAETFISYRLLRQLKYMRLYRLISKIKDSPNVLLLQIWQITLWVWAIYNLRKVAKHKDSHSIRGTRKNITTVRLFILLIECVLREGWANHLLLIDIISHRTEVGHL